MTFATKPDTIQRMNEQDQDNLRFLMTSSEDELAIWYNQTSEDDIEYAMELLASALNEIKLQATDRWDHVEDVTDAMSVLSKFTLH